jgi:hypothetical protein
MTDSSTNSPTMIPTNPTTTTNNKRNILKAAKAAKNDDINNTSNNLSVKSDKSLATTKTILTGSDKSSVILHAVSNHHNSTGGQQHQGNNNNNNNHNGINRNSFRSFFGSIFSSDKTLPLRQDGTSILNNNNNSHPTSPDEPDEVVEFHIKLPPHHQLTSEMALLEDILREPATCKKLIRELLLKDEMAAKQLIPRLKYLVFLLDAQPAMSLNKTNKITRNFFIYESELSLLEDLASHTRVQAKSMDKLKLSQRIGVLLNVYFEILKKMTDVEAIRNACMVIHEQEVE